MIEKAVGIHFGPKSDINKHDELLTRSFSGIIDGITEQGHEVVVTRGAEQLDFENGIAHEIWLPRRTETNSFVTQRLGEASLSMFGSIRDLGKKIRPKAPYDIPLLNGPSVIGYDAKLKSYQDLLFDMKGPTVSVSTASGSELDHLQGDSIVIKPDQGSGGRGVEIVKRHEIQAILGQSPDVSYVAQEYIDMSAPFPSEIKGIDATEQDTLKALSDRKKELRMFTFYNKNETIVVPIARMMKEGDETSDTWLYVDPDSVPTELQQKAKQIFTRLEDKTGASEIYGAVDYMWGSTASEPERQWVVGEVNLWRPALSRRNKDIAQMHDKAMADQLVRMAQVKGGKE